MLPEHLLELSDADRRQIREEVQYAQSIIDSSKKEKEGAISRIFKYLSNSFVLLLVGSLITAFIVPKYQEYRDAQERHASQMHQAFTQFLLYSNSIWEEYYMMFPLVHESKLNQEKYDKYIEMRNKIKLSRYNAYAQVRALSLAFRNSDTRLRSNVEEELDSYARQINWISSNIDDWLQGLYCAPTCISVDADNFGANFTSLGAYADVRSKMNDSSRSADRVSELMIQTMNGFREGFFAWLVSSSLSWRSR